MSLAGKCSISDAAMRKKAPRQASLDEVRITRKGETANIEFADAGISTSHVSVGPALEGMTDADVLNLFNAMLAAQAEFAAGFDSTVVEIPPGRPQIEFHEGSSQWVPRGRVLRCHIEDNEDGEAVILVDDREFDMAAFGDLLKYFAGWGMRIVFVPEDEVTEEPEFEVGDPGDERG